MKLIESLKKIPIDLGQGNLRRTTKGKLIALSYVNININKTKSSKKSNKTETKNRTALDVGCREGIQSKWLERKGYKVTSIDVEKVYEKCKVVNIENGLPFPNESFDLIWCSEVIEHLYKPKEVISEFRRVLKPNGRMVLTTPNSYFLLMRFIHFFGITPRELQNPDHKQFFNERHIRQLFPKAKIYGFFPYMLFKFKIKRLIGLLSPTFVIIDKK